MTIDALASSRNVVDSLRRVAESETHSAVVRRKEVADWVNQRLHNHVDAHPRAGHYRPDVGKLQRVYWSDETPPPVGGGGERLRPGEARLLADAFAKVEHSLRASLLRLTTCVVENDWEAAWGLSEESLRDFGSAGLASAALAWRGVIQRANGDLHGAYESFSAASRTDLGPLSRSTLWSSFFVASQLGEKRLAWKAIDQLDDFDVHQQWSAGHCLLTMLKRRVPADELRSMLDAATEVLNARPGSAVAEALIRS